MLTKKELQNKLGISEATFLNWIKSETLPQGDKNDLYSAGLVAKIIADLERQNKLSSRANRSSLKTKQISYQNINSPERKKLLLELLSHSECLSLSIADAVVELCIEMLKQANLFIEKTRIKTDFLNEFTAEKLQKPTAFAHFVLENKDDDLIGSFYQSLRSIAHKSQSGSFYTPQKLLQNIQISTTARVLEPCCGSGSILLGTLSKNHDTSLIYARDIDPIALLICKTNLALFFNNANLASNFELQDIVFDSWIETKKTVSSKNITDEFDVIISNPPWGSKLTDEQKKQFTYLYSELGNTEVFSAALKNCAQKLSPTGQLYFFLPQSFATVKTHAPIRRFLLEQKVDIHIQLLGNAFKGVLSESILLQVKKGVSNSKIYIENKKSKQNYFIAKAAVKAPEYILDVYTTPQDKQIIEKLHSVFTERLTEENTTFALGIVTGNNARFLQSMSSDKALSFDKKGLAERTADGTEVIFSGKEVLPYHFATPQHTIRLEANKLQQCAPIEHYRAKKIVYRFIGKRLVCLFDESGSLLLNSANLFIQRGYPMQTTVCLFNSPIYSYLLQKQFSSRKILKSHLQTLPLPKLSLDQHQDFAKMHTSILQGNITQNNIDEYICKLAGLTEKDYTYILKEVE